MDVSIAHDPICPGPSYHAAGRGRIDVGAKAGGDAPRHERMIPSGVVEPMIKAERYGRKNGRGF
jgi:hypothetical protein